MVTIALLFAMIPDKGYAAGDTLRIKVSAKGEGLCVKWNKVKGAA